MRRTIAVVTILAFAAASSAGCVRKTHFPPEQIARLRPLMQGEPPRTDSVVLHGDYPARVHGHTDLDLVVAHRGRVLRFAVTPARLAWRTDGLWVDETYLPAREIVGLEMESFSLGRTLGFILLCAGGALVSLFLTVTLLRATSSEE